MVDDLTVADSDTAGIDCTWKAVDTRGLVVHIDLHELTAPLDSSTIFRGMGPSVRHGPHHGGQRSTTTGTVTERSRHPARRWHR